MLKRVKATVMVELPEGAELPQVGQIVTIGEFRAECTGEAREKQKRRGESTEMVYTAVLASPESAQMLKVEGPATPLFDGEGDEG